MLFVNFLQQEEHPSPSSFAGAAPASDDSPDDNDHTVGIADNDEDVLGAGEASPGAAGSGSKRTVQEKEDEGNEELPGLVENDDVRRPARSADLPGMRVRVFTTRVLCFSHSNVSELLLGRNQFHSDVLRLLDVLCNPRARLCR